MDGEQKEGLNQNKSIVKGNQLDVEISRWEKWKGYVEHLIAKGKLFKEDEKDSSGEKPLDYAKSIMNSKPDLKFSSEEAEKIAQLREKFRDEKIGGEKDKPSESLGNLDLGVYPEIPDWEKIDPSKKQISPEKWEEVSGREMLEHVTDKEGGLHQIDVIVPGSVSEIYYKILQEKFPQLGIKTELLNPKINYGRSMKVLIDSPQKNNLEITERIKRPLHSTSVVQALNIDGSPDFPDNNIVLARDLEINGVLPKDAAKKAQARLYLQRIKEYESNKKGDPRYDHYLDAQIKNVETDIKSLGVTPYTDQEIRNLIEPVIDKEWSTTQAQ